MTRTISVVCALTVVVGVTAAGAEAVAKAQTFKNCTEMHKTYKGGVARKGAVDKRTNGGHAKYKPYVDTPTYNANSQSDRDNDGIACEQ